MKPIKAWACVGSHGHVFATDWSPHSPCIGRLQVYLTREDALKNDSNVVEVSIRPVRAKKEKVMKVFRVKTPSGVIAEGVWKSIAEIPSKIPDRFNFYFSPEDTEIFEVEMTEEQFRKEKV